MAAKVQLPHLPYATNFAGTQLLYFLLGPAFVAHAIPMGLSLEHLRRGFWPTLFALLAGCLVGAASGYLLVRFCSGSTLSALSMQPKSLTTPIPMGISETIWGIPALSAVFAILGGIITAVFLMPMLRLLRFDDPAATGLAAGVAGSGIAEPTLVPLGLVQAAFASVAIGLNGLMTAVVAPPLAQVLARF